MKFVARLLLLICCCFFTITAKAQDAEVASFKIDVQQSGESVELTCHRGCYWKNLSFNLDTHVDANGMTDPEGNTRKYLFSFTRNGNEVVLKSLRGTAWKELSFTLGKNMKASVDQYGVETKAKK
ncbi:hypothetical protein [Lewinella sp. 4G2]|uniref:hypothetical protein n=1 Tax=Lewinella sp. 4G2 TaxID=1803372 RepID=UPI0012FC8B7F|nr:hypothetical protein [Lewinella sp. 4G2]